MYRALGVYVVAGAGLTKCYRRGLKQEDLETVSQAEERWQRYSHRADGIFMWMMLGMMIRLGSSGLKDSLQAISYEPEERFEKDGYGDDTSG